MVRRHPRLAALLAALLLIPLAAGIVLAQAGALEKLRSGDTVLVGSGETIDTDLYAFGGTVRVDGTINGDLVTSGGQIDVSGTVDGDILAAGGQVTVSGTVTGDVRAAGGMITLSGETAEDALVAGGTVTIPNGGSVGEDVIVSAGQLTIDGTVTGSVTGSAGQYSRGGQIGGAEDVHITGGMRAPTEPTPASRVADAVRHFLVVLLVGGLLLGLAPRLYASLQSSLVNDPVKSAAWGLVGLIGFIVLVVAITIVMILLAVPLGLLRFDGLVAVDVIGGLLGIFGLSLALAIVAAWVADAVVGAAIANLIPKAERSNRWQEFALMAAGAAVVVFFSSLPLVGVLVKLIVVVLGLGVLLVALNGRLRSSPAAAGPGIAAPAA
jgi:cytoskeletal protein CcmA (bactofilin family)